jgi:RimJ/RimL family protein N-acetyltransferase
MTWCHRDYSLEDCRAFIARCRADWEKGKEFNFAVFDVRDETLLGCIALNRIDRTNLSANIGYWVRQTWARHGVAAAATRLIAEFGLNEVGLQRLEILVPCHNLASQRVAEKIGAQFEGVLRKRVVLNDKTYDARLYSLVPGDLTPSLPPHTCQTRVQNSQ